VKNMTILESQINDCPFPPPHIKANVHSVLCFPKVSQFFVDLWHGYGLFSHSKNKLKINN